MMVVGNAALVIVDAIVATAKTARAVVVDAAKNTKNKNMKS